jgi:twinkle protein
MAVNGQITSIPDRKISEATCKKYNVRTVRDNSNKIIQHLYPYYDRDNNHIGDKVRNLPKDIRAIGNVGQGTLFGQNLFNQGGKYVTICEGELDALAAYEMLGSKWPVLSIKDGAASALRNCKASLEYLSQYDNIVLCFDNDDAGRKAAKQVASLFEPNQCKIVHLEYKDACEYIQNGKREEFTRAWWNAKIYTPAGILNLADMGDALYEEGDYKTCLYPWHGINDKLYGIRTGELVTFTAGTGTGKSSVIRELMHHVLNNTEENIGVISLEENVRSTIFHLMSVEANARLYIREIREQFSREDLTTWQ